MLSHDQITKVGAEVRDEDRDASHQLEISTSSNDQQSNCPECGRIFSTRQNLATHIRRFHKVHYLTCGWPGCNKQYKHRWDLTSHVKVAHKGEKVLCPHCGSQFSKKSNLHNHLTRGKGCPRAHAAGGSESGVQSINQSSVLRQGRKLSERTSSEDHEESSETSETGSVTGKEAATSADELEAGSTGERTDLVETSSATGTTDDISDEFSETGEQGKYIQANEMESSFGQSRSDYTTIDRGGIGYYTASDSYLSHKDTNGNSAQSSSNRVNGHKLQTYFGNWKNGYGRNEGSANEGDDESPLYKFLKENRDLLRPRNEPDTPQNSSIDNLSKQKQETKATSSNLDLLAEIALNGPSSSPTKESASIQSDSDDNVQQSSSQKMFNLHGDLVSGGIQPSVIGANVLQSLQELQILQNLHDITKAKVEQSLATLSRANQLSSLSPAALTAVTQAVTNVTSTVNQTTSLPAAVTQAVNISNILSAVSQSSFPANEQILKILQTVPLSTGGAVTHPEDPTRLPPELIKSLSDISALSSASTHNVHSSGIPLSLSASNSSSDLLRAVTHAGLQQLLQPKTSASSASTHSDQLISLQQEIVKQQLLSSAGGTLQSNPAVSIQGLQPPNLSAIVNQAANVSRISQQSLQSQLAAAEMKDSNKSKISALHLSDPTSMISKALQQTDRQDISPVPSSSLFSLSNTQGEQLMRNSSCDSLTSSVIHAATPKYPLILPHSKEEPSQSYPSPNIIFSNTLNKLPILANNQTTLPIVAKLETLGTTVAAARTPSSYIHTSASVLVDKNGTESMEVHHQDAKRDDDVGREGRKAVRCEQCGRICSTQAHLNNHVRFVHSNEKSTMPKTLQCPSCEKKFGRQSHLAEHVKTVHEGRKRKYQPAECEHCGKMFARQCSLNQHVSATHADVRSTAVGQETCK